MNRAKAILIGMVLAPHRSIGTALAASGIALASAATRSARSPDRLRFFYRLLDVTSPAVAVQDYFGGAVVIDGLDHLAY